MAYNYFGQYPYMNGYLPQGYQPIMLQAQGMPQQQPTPMQNQNSIIWVNSDMEVMSYPVAPNNAVTLWNAKEPVVYLKKADSTGKPTITVYDLVERTQSVSDSTSFSGDKNVYATKEDLGKVVGVVQGIDDIINAMRSDIDTIKSDMYGSTAKKKPPVKKEVTEDDA
jgi:hypothetical protein